MTSILFIVQFNNFALTMGFYWSHTLLLMSLVLMHTCLYQGMEPSYYLSRQCVPTMHVVLALIRNIHNLAFEKEEGGGRGGERSPLFVEGVWPCNKGLPALLVCVRLEHVLGGVRYSMHPQAELDGFVFGPK